jgi:hypothetical protein
MCRDLVAQHVGPGAPLRIDVNLAMEVELQRKVSGVHHTHRFDVDAKHRPYRPVLSSGTTRFDSCVST